MGSYAESCAERIWLLVLDLSDLDHLRLVAKDILPHVCEPRHQCAAARPRYASRTSSDCETSAIEPVATI